jgi:cytochrome c
MVRTVLAQAARRNRSRSALLALVAVSIALPIGTSSAFAQLRGHGGPVRALAISADGQSAISGSFDSTAIRWSLTRNAAEQVLRFHSDAVNAVALLGEKRAATAGADGRIAIWTFGRTEPDAVFEGHTAPIAALAVSPDGATLASASWDHTVRLWPLAGGAPRVLDEHTQNVNGVAFTADGRALVSVSYDPAFGSGRCRARKRRPSLRCRPRSTPWPPAWMVKSRSAARTATSTS